MEGVVITNSPEMKKGVTIGAAIKTYGERIFRYIRQRVRSTADAEDVLQDVWYQLSALTDPEEIGNLSAWLYRVARHKLIDRSRRKTLHSADELERVTDAELFSFFSEPVDEVWRELFWKTMFAALDELPDAQRLVFIQNELEEKTLQAIAEESGENIKTIISRKGYAVKHLRQRLLSLYQEMQQTLK